MAKRKASKGVPKIGRVLAPKASVGKPVLPATTKVNFTKK